MPKNTAINPDIRERIGDEIAVGFGRNDIARRYHVSPGLVSKIARERGLGFRNAEMVDDAVRARQIDMWAARVEREAQLETEYIKRIGTRDPRSTKPTRAEKRLSYALYNVNRHHNGTYR